MAIQLTQEMINGARKTEQLTGVPASVTLAQIIEESSGYYVGGMSGLAYEGKNLFGVKATSEKQDYIEMKDGNGNLQRWRKYNSFYDSITDHAYILNLSRYKKHYADATSVNDYAYALQKGGYAGESTTYANKLITHIEENNLTQYDLKNLPLNPISLDENGGMTEETSDEVKTLNLGGNIMRFLSIFFVVVVGVFFLIKSINAGESVKKAVINKVKGD